MKIASTAQRLQQILSERNLKQADVLRLAEPYCQKYRQKLGRSDLSQFVSGKVVPGQWKLTLLSLALNVSETWLMGYDVPQERDSQPTGLEATLDLSADKKITPGEGQLTEGEKELLDLFNLVPEEQQHMVLEMIRAALRTK